MAKPRVTATDRLSNVVEVVQMGRRAGLLSVERGAGSVLEVGEIYFVSGSPIYASLAGLRGREALAALAQWGPCRFAFDGTVPPPLPNITSTDPALKTRPGSPSTRSWDGSLDNSLSAGKPRDTITDGSGIWSLPSGSTGRLGNDRRNTGNQIPTRPLTSPDVSTPRQFGGSGAVPPSAPNLGKRPRRAPDVRDLMQVVTAYNLSRNHRTVLLLADGEHTVLDLARLSSKPIDEITTLLAELELRGLVYYYSAE